MSHNNSKRFFNPTKPKLSLKTQRHISTRSGKNNTGLPSDTKIIRHDLVLKIKDKQYEALENGDEVNVVRRLTFKFCSGCTFPKQKPQGFLVQTDNKKPMPVVLGQVNRFNNQLSLKLSPIF